MRSRNQEIKLGYRKLEAGNLKQEVGTKTRKREIRTEVKKVGIQR